MGDILHSQSLWNSTEKLNETQQKSKHAKYTTTQNEPKKPKPDLIGMYNLWPENASGLFSKK